ncbi:MAG: lipoyl synthase [Prevotellaceae bacterium]|jgi:lipoic acid synthetase|nr:lipoyl synthase [Prevotellaceae bacterium]
MSYTVNRRKPEWLRIKLPQGSIAGNVQQIIQKHNIHTICSSGLCPNRGECWGCGTATFMIGGDICTRACKFCNVKTGKPLPLDPNEPNNIAQSVKLMGLKHAVITSVDRDDLADYGASHWANVIRAVKELNPSVTMEVLIPDFQGKNDLVRLVIDAKPEVISHNLETVKSLTPKVRSKATYQQSLSVIKQVAESGIVAKSGIMLGLGETREEILETMDDLRKVGCHALTIGQYLQPSAANVEVKEYVTPETFAEYKNIGLEKGFTFVESSPLVRSSYHADKQARALDEQKKNTAKLNDLGEKSYKETWDLQLQLQSEIIQEKEQNKPSTYHILLVEHPAVYTLGRNGKQTNMLINEKQLQSNHAEFIKVDRGGDITFHGKGQLVVYPILDLEHFRLGLKEYIHKLEEVVINTIAHFGLKGERVDRATGVWLDKGKQTERKICAIGVKCSRFVTMHGFALNVNTDLSYFSNINPCGFIDKGVTSIEKEVGENVNLNDIKLIVTKQLKKVFNLNLL